MIKSTKTLILLGAFTFGVSACDGQEAPETAADSSNASDDAQADAQEAKTFRDAGDLAICLSGCGESHCALAVGGCLRAASECGGEEGCEVSYNECAQEYIGPGCNLEEGKDIELAGALNCWGTFQGCLNDSDDSVACVTDLYLCAQEGCGEDGCEDVEFSADDVFPEPEKFDESYRP